MEFKKTTTDRGFNLIEFMDLYNQKCTIQESSLATDTAIWFGIDEVEAKILACDAKALGIETDAEVGWITYPIPSKVLLSSRMHLSADSLQ